MMSALTKMLVSRTIRTRGVYLGLDKVHEFLLIRRARTFLDAGDGGDRSQNREDCGSDVFRGRTVRTGVERCAGDLGIRLDAVLDDVLRALIRRAGGSMTAPGS